MAQEPAGEAEVLRVAIRGGGCSGFEYALGFDRGPSEGDLEAEVHGVRVVVDPFSAPYLQGAKVDFVETIQEAGFKIDNPNAAGSCGCGHSFQRRRGRRARTTHGRAAAARPAATELRRALTLRVAIVGSGPAGFYTAAALQASDLPVEVDMIERLPTPWGLVRLGVAPDHPNIKAVSRAFEKIARDRRASASSATSRSARTSTHDELARLYDAVVYTVGAQTDRRLGIPGEDLPGSWPATEFVAWYNGHPDFQHLDVRPLRRARGRDRERQRRGRRRADARADRATSSRRPTRPTRRSPRSSAPGIREIVMLGRRGPAQAAFTPPELQELGELAGADVVVDPADLELDAASAAALEDDRATARRNVEILREYATRDAGRQAEARSILRFCVSPVAILGDGQGRGDRGRAQRARRRRRRRGSSAVPTGEIEVIPCGARPAQRRLPRRRRCRACRSTSAAATIPNDDGRVVDEDGSRVRGVYCAGWIKRGPSGVIGTNKKDATETVERLLEDARAGPARARERRRRSRSSSRERGVDFVEYAGWEAIDAHERARGEPAGPAARQARELGRAARARPAARIPRLDSAG